MASFCDGCPEAIDEAAGRCIISQLAVPMVSCSNALISSNKQGVVEAFLVPDSLLREEQQFSTAFDFEGHFLVDESPHSPFRVVVLLELGFDVGEFQVGDLGFVGGDRAPEGDLLVGYFFGLGQKFCLDD